MQCRKVQGFALITVLIFLEIFAVITVFCLHSASWEIKLTEARFEKNKMSQAARTILQNVEFLTQNPACQIPITSAYQLSQQPLVWWQRQSCAGNFNLFQYYYVVESLADDPCAVLNTGKAAHYTRITLLTLLKTDDKIKMLLQSAVITAAGVVPHCEAKLHAVQLGRQSSRAIIY